ncbi:DUF3830 family protein [Croceicoccus bisphenolivorans]|uniref:DUF3830 family protein n=1 Tax=Croceicoccus bisphenolivorans TaxID=1783232 RepID=UPI00082B59E2|nr:DUF3830 family protein [Croceicoccus bisphenolivorans]
MTLVSIKAGPYEFTARLEEELAPVTAARFKAMMPYDEKVIHVRWSGEGVWIPMGDDAYDLPWENPTRYPAPGEFIFYPGGYSETEILLAYGGVAFASKLGPLAGIHFMTIIEGNENLAALGKKTLWDGAQTISFALKD